MPVYEYEHTKEYCDIGRLFEIEQSIHDDPLNHCPKCHKKVKKLISIAYINTPKSNTELRDMGFTKLVKRDDGVYENVTARGNDSKFVDSNKPETLPDLSKTIRD